jgi:hypothetical protein
MDQLQLLEVKFEEGIELSLVAIETQGLTDDLICPICSNLVFNPVICKETQCIFCKECITKWVKKIGDSASCPQCQQVFIFDVLPRLIKNLINRVKLRCFFHQQGCQVIVLYEQFISHVKSCEFSTYKCLVSPQCNFSGTKNEVLSHINICSITTCKYCEKEFSKKSLEDHLLICETALIYCPVCFTKDIQRKEFLLHNHGICFDKMMITYAKHEFSPPLEDKSQLEISKKENKKLEVSIELIKQENVKIKNEFEQTRSILLKQLEDKEKYERDIKSLTLRIESFKLSKQNIDDKCEHSNSLWHLPAIESFCVFCGRSEYCRFKCADCFRFYCRFCKPIPKQNTCPIGHQILLKQKCNYFCDICFILYDSDTYVWNDASCDLDVCINCWPIPQINVNTPKQEPQSMLNLSLSNLKDK